MSDKCTRSQIFEDAIISWNIKYSIVTKERYRMMENDADIIDVFCNDDGHKETFIYNPKNDTCLYKINEQTTNNYYIYVNSKQIKRYDESPYKIARTIFGKRNDIELEPITDIFLAQRNY